MPHLSPTTLTSDEQRLILRATAGNVRDHLSFSLALGTGLRLAEIVGLDVGDVSRLDESGRGECDSRVQFGRELRTASRSR